METDTRQRIVTAALRLFAARGVAGVTLREIARESEVLIGTIFHYFPQKDALYKEALIEAYQGRSRKIAAALSGSGPAQERLRRFVKDMLSSYNDNDPHYLLVDRSSADHSAELISRAVMGNFKANYLHLEAVISEITGEDPSPRPEDPRVGYVFGLIFGYSKFYRDYGNITRTQRGKGVDSVVEDLMAFLLKSLLATSARAKNLVRAHGVARRTSRS